MNELEKELIRVRVERKLALLKVKQKLKLVNRVLKSDIYSKN